MAAMTPSMEISEMIQYMAAAVMTKYIAIKDTTCCMAEVATIHSMAIAEMTFFTVRTGMTSFQGEVVLTCYMAEKAIIP